MMCEDIKKPDFIIVGAQKCGTTYLHKFLCEHTDIFCPREKELNFFDWNFARGISWYEQQFKLAPKGAICGEASPYYIAHPHALQRVKQYIPDVKLVMLKRDPIERAYSHYWHEVKLGFEYLSFTEALRSESKRTDDEWKKMKNNPDYYSFECDHYSYVARGNYVAQERRALSIFSPSQMFCVDVADLNNKKVMDSLFDFLTLSKSGLDIQNFSINFKKVYPKLDHQTLKTCAEYFNYA